MNIIDKEITSIFVDSRMFPNRTSRIHTNTTPTYPPYNIVQVSETKKILEMAVAGFSESEIDVSVEDDKLIILGKKEETETPRTYVYKGIGARPFERTFTLTKGTIIEGAEYTDGILSVFVAYEVPEAKKPKSIKIQRGDRLYLTE